jgi:hypothetical protein
MINEGRNRLLIFVIAILIVFFGYLVTKNMDAEWYIFPFQVTLSLISIVLLLFSNKSLYLYFVNANPKYS